MPKPVHFPSVALPGPSAVRIDVPDDWSSFPAPGAVLVAAPEFEQGSFSPSVVVAVHRVAPTTTLDDLLRLAREASESLPGRTEVSTEAVWVSDADAALTTATLDVDDAEFPGLSVTQLELQLLTQVSEEVSDAVTVTATFDSAQAGSLAAPLREMLMSVRVSAPELLGSEDH